MTLKMPKTKGLKPLRSLSLPSVTALHRRSIMANKNSKGGGGKGAAKVITKDVRPQGKAYGQVSTDRKMGGKKA